MSLPEDRCVDWCLRRVVYNGQHLHLHEGNVAGQSGAAWFVLWRLDRPFNEYLPKRLGDKATPFFGLAAGNAAFDLAESMLRLDELPAVSP